MIVVTDLYHHANGVADALRHWRKVLAFGPFVVFNPKGDIISILHSPRVKWSVTALGVRRITPAQKWRWTMPECDAR
jgi:hypothetical protein